MGAARLFGASRAAPFASAVGFALEIEIGQTPLGPDAVAGLWFGLSLATRFVVYVRVSIESFHYHAMLKRLLSLGFL